MRTASGAVLAPKNFNVNGNCLCMVSLVYIVCVCVCLLLRPLLVHALVHPPSPSASPSSSLLAMLPIAHVIDLAFVCVRPLLLLAHCACGSLIFFLILFLGGNWLRAVCVASTVLSCAM